MNVFLVSMGCAKNTVDSERLMGRLAALGHRAVEYPQEADVGIINTCGFIQDAVKENIDAILDLEQMKEQGVLPRIIVVGCLVNRYEAELRKELPTVDLFARAEEWDKVAAFLTKLVREEKGIRFLRGEERRGKNVGCAEGRVLLSPGTPWSRYLKVSEGCDAHCSYCTIPGIRGRLRSTPLEELVEEAHALCAAGAKELCLVGQDLTVYGQDIYGKPALKRLLTTLGADLPKGTWLRLLYLHPKRVTEDVVDCLLETEKVLHYLDIPIQHVNEEILARMNRFMPKEDILRIFHYIRERDPLFALRTTVMVGFPGETRKKFLELCDFLDEVQLDHVGVFTFSPEEGTPAVDFAGPVSEKTADRRYTELMDRQLAIEEERAGLFVGKELDALIEEDFNPVEGTVWGRTFRDAPEVDGQICVEEFKKPLYGHKIRVRVTDTLGGDLLAERVKGKQA